MTNMLLPGNWTWPVPMADDERKRREQATREALAARRQAMFRHLAWWWK